MDGRDTASSTMVTAPERPPAPARPVDRSYGGRWLLRALFWAGLAAVLVPWWLDTAAGSMAEPGATMTAAGRITGLVAGYLLLMQVLMMSRLGPLERWVGVKRLLLWHRELGGYLVVTVLAHTALITVGYAEASQATLTGETWDLLVHFEDMVTAYAAVVLLTGIGLLSIRALRRALTYEVWYILHVTAYLVLLLGYAHQFSDGQDMARPGPVRWYWIALYTGVLAAVVWGRLLGPLLLNLRHRLRIAEIVAEGPGMTSVYVTGRRLDLLGVKAGQFFRWRFLARGLWLQAHPFSLSAAPNKHWLRVTIKTVGDHTERLRWLHPGIRVLVDGPAGDFTADRRTRSKTLLIAGGSGIAPVRALLEEVPSGAVVVYRASSADDLVFREELEALADERGAVLWYVVGPRDAPGPRQLFTPRGFRELIPDVTRRDVYLCGPQGLIDSSVRLLRRLGVPRRQIHLDPFEF